MPEPSCLAAGGLRSQRDRALGRRDSGSAQAVSILRVPIQVSSADALSELQADLTGASFGGWGVMAATRWRYVWGGTPFAVWSRRRLVARVACPGRLLLRTTFGSERAREVLAEALHVPYETNDVGAPLSSTPGTVGEVVRSRPSNGSPVRRTHACEARALRMGVRAGRSHTRNDEGPLAAALSSERETGFEPATSTLARWHSTTELLPHSHRIRVDTAREKGFRSALSVPCQRNRALARSRSLAIHWPTGRLPEAGNC